MFPYLTEDSSLQIFKNQFFQGAHGGKQFDEQLRQPGQGAAVLQEHKASHSHETPFFDQLTKSM